MPKPFTIWSLGTRTAPVATAPIASSSSSTRPASLRFRKRSGRISVLPVSDLFSDKASRPEVTQVGRQYCFHVFDLAGGDVVLEHSEDSARRILRIDRSDVIQTG